jgi:hypothetical protein
MVARVSGPQEAEVLSVEPAGGLQVRLAAATDPFQRLQAELGRRGAELPRLRELAAGQCCAALWRAAWTRGLLEGEEAGGWRVRLVDLGRREVLGPGALRELPEELAAGHAHCFPCHLPGCGAVGQAAVERALAGLSSVTLIRRGAPELRAGAWSLPVELSWQEADCRGPVVPAATRPVFLSQRLLAPPAEPASGGEVGDGGQEEDLLLPSALARSQEVEGGFCWLDPELPDAPRFCARATFVDAAGQIYLQMAGLQEGYAELRVRMGQVR